MPNYEFNILNNIPSNQPDFNHETNKAKLYVFFKDPIPGSYNHDPWSFSRYISLPRLPGTWSQHLRINRNNFDNEWIEFLLEGELHDRELVYTLLNQSFHNLVHNGILEVFRIRRNYVDV